MTALLWRRRGAVACWRRSHGGAGRDCWCWAGPRWGARCPPPGLLARPRSAAAHGPVRPWRGVGCAGRARAAGGCRRRRAGCCRTADARRRVPGRRPRARSVGRAGRGSARSPGRRPWRAQGPGHADAGGVPARAEPGVERRGSRARAPRREPPRPRLAVRLPGHVCDTALGQRQAAAHAARACARRVRGCQPEERPAGPARAAPARRGGLPLAAHPGGLRGGLPPPALDGRRGAALPARCARPRGGGRARAAARQLVARTPAAPARDGQRRAGPSRRPGCRCTAGLRRERHAGGRPPDAGRAAHAAGRHRGPGLLARTLGGGGPRAAARHADALSGPGTHGRGAWAFVRRGRAAACGGLDPRGRRRRGAGARLGRGGCGRLAGHHAARAAQPRGPGARDPWRRVQRHPPPLPGGGAALAAPALEPRPGCVPGRRHGLGQDGPAAGPAARSQAGTRRGPDPQRAGGAGLASGQLGCGGRTLRAHARRARSTRLGHTRRRAGSAHTRAARGA